MYKLNFYRAFSQLDCITSHIDFFSRTENLEDKISYQIVKNKNKYNFNISANLDKSELFVKYLSYEKKKNDPANIKIIGKYQKDENIVFEKIIFNNGKNHFKVKNLSENKIKKNKDLKLDFEKNIDILKLISKNNNKPKLVIGFSAETNNLHSNSKQKLQNKGCDWIIANDVSKNDIGFDSDFNEVSIFYKDKNVEDEIISKTYKSVVADEIVKRVINQLNLI